MATGPQFDLILRGELGDYGTLIAAGNTWQKLLDANNNWAFMRIQNPTSSGEILKVYFGLISASLTASAVELGVGEFFEFRIPGFIPTQQVNVYAATMNHPVICWAV